MPEHFDFSPQAIEKIRQSNRPVPHARYDERVGRLVISQDSNLSRGGRRPQSPRSLHQPFISMVHTSGRPASLKSQHAPPPPSGNTSTLGAATPSSTRASIEVDRHDTERTPLLQDSAERMQYDREVREQGQEESQEQQNGSKLHSKLGLGSCFSCFRG